jgi:hypothetical protein
MAGAPGDVRGLRQAVRDYVDSRLKQEGRIPLSDGGVRSGDALAKPANQNGRHDGRPQRSRRTTLSDREFLNYLGTAAEKGESLVPLLAKLRHPQTRKPLYQGEKTLRNRIDRIASSKTREKARTYLGEILGAGSA